MPCSECDGELSGRSMAAVGSADGLCVGDAWSRAATDNGATAGPHRKAHCTFRTKRGCERCDHACVAVRSYDGDGDVDGGDHDGGARCRWR